MEAAQKYGAIAIDDKLPDAFTDMSATLTKVWCRPDALLISGQRRARSPPRARLPSKR
jgi:hypothetical protein